jgi:hypothetical protein
MYKANKKCSSAFKLIQQNTCHFNKKQDLNAFKFNRDQVKQFYSTQPTKHSKIKKLMVANRGKFK